MEHYQNNKSVSRIQILQMLIAILTLITMWLALPAQYYQIVDIANLLSKEKPLEGIWNYKSNYTKYYNDTIYEEPDVNALYGKGNALIVWKNIEEKYEVYINYGVYRYGNSKAILAASLNGYISEIDNKGFPKNSNFKIEDLKIINRVHHQNADPSTEIYEFINCNTNIINKRADRITCDFVPRFSSSNVKLEWKSSLH
ncbi:MAG: hypothetical protein LM517_02675 [Nitrosomonas sp.]|nr:hypothetical protein [Nitrosomonas sp.]